MFAEGQRLEERVAYRFARCTEYGGRWIRHGDWYPDWQTRLWRRGRGRWGGVDPHDRLEVDGAVGTLEGELEHRSFEGMAQHVSKALRYAEVFERECSARGRRVTALDVVFRPPWRFVRSYFLRLGMLDGWAGFDVAWMSAFYTYLRYQRVHAARRRVDKG